LPLHHNLLSRKLANDGADDLDHRHNEKPKPPNANCTDRERRLYERNMAKYDQQIHEKYSTYRKAFNLQQTLLGSSSYSRIDSTIIMPLPRLENIVLSNVGRCCHSLSDRFIQDFPITCAFPMNQNSIHSTFQLKQLVLPTGKILLHLRGGAQ
jgi:hypothetical protein